MTTETTMNQPTIADQLQEKPKYRDIEIRHLNAVCKELQDELKQYEACAAFTLSIAKIFGMGCSTVAEVDTEHLRQFIVQVKNSAQLSSNHAGQLQVNLENVMVQLETIKADMRRLHPHYEFHHLAQMASNMDMSRFGEKYARITRQNKQPELWDVINKHPIKVVRNMDTDKRDSAYCAFATCGEFELLHDALEHSAADLLHRGEV